jgi:CRISPR-associated protein Cas1
VYREHSNRTGVKWDRRTFDPDNWDGGDLVNQALSAANSALYGVVHAVVVALGCSPALGFIHTGHHRSFVYDIADLYKAEITIPLAFDIAAEEPEDLGGETRRRMRDELYDGKLLARCSTDIRNLLQAEPGTESEEALDDLGDVISLWDERSGQVAGGTSYEVPF